MKDQRGVVGWIILGIFLAGVFVAGCIAVVNNEDSWAPTIVASHEYDDGGDCEWRGDCGGGYDERNGGYGDGRGGDGRFGGGRSGDYDGGDGDGDRCRNICNNTFPLPGGGEGGGQRV